VATWGVFEDKSTGKRLFMLNTHLDHMGKVARHEGALLVINKVKELSRNYPVIVTGDFNAVPTDDPIQVLTNSRKDIL
jgi:Endonuclease/Exonuclease/phosphatase family.